LSNPRIELLTSGETGLRVVAALFPVALGGAFQLPAWANGANPLDELLRAQRRGGATIATPPVGAPPLLYDGGYRTNKASDLFTDTRVLEAQRYLIHELVGYREVLRRTYSWVNNSGRFWYTGSEQPREPLRKHRPAEIVPLGLITVVRLKKCQIFRLFHALGNDPQLQAAAHADHCAHDARLVGSSGDLTDERLVDFEGIDRKFSQIAQAGVPRAKVIDR
jgi:hypothetical protein